MYTPSAWVVTFMHALSLSLVYMSHDECTVRILHTLLNCHCSYFDACINLDFMWVLNINNQELLLRINWLESIVHKYTLGPSSCFALNLLIVMRSGIPRTRWTSFLLRMAQVRALTHILLTRFLLHSGALVDQFALWTVKFNKGGYKILFYL